jgi:hypothetical protein
MATIPIRNFVLSTTPRRRPALTHSRTLKPSSLRRNTGSSFILVKARDLNGRNQLLA